MSSRMRLVRLVGQRVFDVLQALDAFAQGRGRPVVAEEDAHREEGLGPEQLVVVGLVGADLRVQAAEAAGIQAASPDS